MNTTPTQRRSKSRRDTTTRADLLAAARVCVRDRGLAGTTSRDITTLAGANLAAITYHFGAKDDLVAEALFDELRRRIEPALDVLDGSDPVTAMLTAVTRLTSDFEANRTDAPLYLEALVASTRPGPYAKTAQALLRKVRTRLADLIGELVAAGLVPSWVEPQAMAALIVSVANGVALQVSIDPGGPAHDVIAGQFASLLVSARETP